MTRAHASEKNDSIGKTQGILDIDFSLLLKAEIDLFFLGVDIKKEEEDLDSNELDQNGLPQPGKSMTVIMILLTASNNQFRNESEFSQFIGPCF